MATEEQKKEVRDKVHELVTTRFGGDYRKAFDFYDSAPKDGSIDVGELTSLLSDAGIGNWFTRDAWVAGIIDELDADQNGAISAAEFEAVLNRILP